MADGRQILTINLSKGINEEIDEFLLPEGELTVAQNVELDKLGTMNKRDGFDRVPADPSNTTVLGSTWNGAATRLIEYEDERLLSDGLHLWSYSSNDQSPGGSEAGWVQKDHVPISNVTRRTVTRHSARSLCSPDVDNTAGYRLHVWVEPDRRNVDESTSFNQGGLPRYGIGSPSQGGVHYLPFNDNEGQFSEGIDEGLGENLFSRAQNGTIRCKLDDGTKAMNVWCDECVATYASSPKVVALDSVFVIGYLRHKVVFHVETASAGDWEIKVTTNSLGESTASYTAGGGDSSTTIASEMASDFDAVSGLTSNSSGDKFEVIFDQGEDNKITIEVVSTGSSGVLVGPEMDNVTSVNLAIVDIDDPQDRVVPDAVNRASSCSLYDMQKERGGMSEWVWATFDGTDINVDIMDSSLATVDSRAVTDDPVNVLGCYAHESDDVVAIGYESSGNGLTVRTFPYDLSSETADVDHFTDKNNFYQVGFEKFDSSNIVVAAEVEDILSGA